MGDSAAFASTRFCTLVAGLGLLMVIVSGFRPAGANAEKPLLPEPAKELKPVYSSWIKFCRAGGNAPRDEVCFTFMNGRIADEPAVAVVLIEPTNEAKKTLRVTLPLGMDLQKGTQIMIDGGNQLNAAYFTCVRDGCVADYDAEDELISKLKSGQRLIVEGVIGEGPEIRFVLPLADFEKVYDAPPSDPTLFQ